MYRRNFELRLVVAFVAGLIYAFTLFPLQATIISIVLILGYVAFTFYSRKHTIDEGKTNRRKTALYSARAFLGNYDDLWKGLRLSNSYCYLSLVDEMTIIGTEKKPDGGDYRSFKVIKSNVHDWDEVWNLFCINFSHNKTYDGLVEDCRLYKLVIEEKFYDMPEKRTFQKQDTAPQKISNLVQANEAMVDINNASVEEIAALPGISVIMAKKAIKKREDIGGFKSVQDFLLFLKIKEHMQQQLINMVCVNKMKYSAKIERYGERNVDL